MKNRTPLLALLMLLPLSLEAGELDTISYFNRRSGYFFYRSRDVVMQAARFIPNAPGLLRRMELTLSGTSKNGEARVRIFGHEGGSAAPMVERDLVDPIRIRKTKAGVEKITIDLPEPVRISGSQFFIAVDQAVGDILLVSDRRRRKPDCVSSSGEYSRQQLKYADGSWKTGDYSYAIRAVVEYDAIRPFGYFQNITETANVDRKFKEVAGIAWADIDADRYSDLLAGGRLYRNNGNETFSDITTRAGLTERTLLSLFIDADNDRDMDILLFESSGERGTSEALLINDGYGDFRRHAVDLPDITRPSTYSIADANGDGYLDVFIGEFSSGLKQGGRYLLLNNHELGFNDGSYSLADTVRDDIVGSRWRDSDRDGLLDLFVSSRTGSLSLWSNNGRQGFEKHRPSEPLSAHIAPLTGVDWADYDNDGLLDLLEARAVGVRQARESIPVPTAMFSTSTSVDVNLSLKGVSGVEYEEKPAGVAWADVNNDGLPDFLLTTSCSCRTAQLYVQQSDGTFLMETFTYGLQGVPLERDVAWVDFNNDGRIDLSGVVAGRLVLYKNVHTTNSAWADVDLDRTGAEKIGAVVTVHAGEHRYTEEVVSGRGRLMQEPLQLHFGLSNARRIDSIVIQWPGAARSIQTLPGGDVGRVYRIESSGGSSIASGEIQAHAFPNPTAADLNITYTISTPGIVSVEIFNLAGQKIATLVNENKLAGSHQVTWRPLDAGGKRFPQGTYTYRITADNSEVTGKIVLRN